MAISSAPTNGAGVGEAFLHNAAATAFVWTLAGAPAAGETLFLYAAAAPNTNRVTALVQTNVVWTLLGRSNVLADAEEWIGIVSASASATINGTSLINGSTANIRGNVSVWSGNPSVTHIAASGTSGSSTSPLTTAVTPANGVDVLILACCRLTSGGIGAPSGGFTALTSGSTGYGFAYRRVVGDGVTSYQCGWTGTTSAWDTVITAMTTPAATTLSFTTQPAASIASGGTLTPQVTADASASGLTCTLTLTGPNGSATGLTAVHNASGVATFATIPTGDGPGYTLTAATAGYTGATSSSFTVIGAVVAAAQTHVTNMGGNTKLFSSNLVGMNATGIYPAGALASLPDVIGPIGGRAAGLTFAAATAPVMAGGVLTFTGASSQSMATPADARLNFSGSIGTPNPTHMFVYVEATGTGPIATVAADPTSTTTYPYESLQAVGVNYRAKFASDGATPTPTNPPIPNTAGIFEVDLETAFADGLSHAFVLGKPGFQNQSNVDSIFLALCGGDNNQPAFPRRVTTPTAGNLKACVGRFGGNYGTFNLRGVEFYNGDLGAAELREVWRFARAIGCTVSISTMPSLAVPGNSWVMSTTHQPGGDMQQPTDGSGTTSFPYAMVRHVSGTRGSILNQGLKLTDVRKFAYGRSGKMIQDVVDTFDVELGLLWDGSRTGNIVIVHYDVGNSMTTLSTAQYLSAAAALKAKCDAYSSLYGIPSKLVHMLDLDRTSYYNTAWPTIPSGHSTQGTNRVAVAVAMLASPATYGALVWDAAASVAAGAIGNFGAPSCYSTTYYNITANGGFAGGDATHGAPAIYAALGQSAKVNIFDANDTLLYPLATAGGSLTFDTSYTQRLMRRSRQ